MDVKECSFHPGEVIDKRYTVIKRLGEGSFGCVYLVKAAGNQVFALKILKLWSTTPAAQTQLLKRFDREYKTGQIKSDFLVHSYGKGEVHGNPYFVMDYCSYGDLVHADKSKINLSLIAMQILQGLKALHQNGKVHRDLKPENVLLKSYDHAVLTDFGIAGDKKHGMTVTGQVLGTYAYMPPEQANPPSKMAILLPTTDIFSFGVMIYQWITNSFPFGDPSNIALYLSNGAKGVWDRNALRSHKDGSAWLPLIERCLVPDFNQRINTVDQVISMLPYTSVNKYVVDKQAVKNFKSDASNGLLLRVTQGEEPGKVYQLDECRATDASIVYMGRKDTGVGNGINILEEETSYISRYHCTLEYDNYNKQWHIRDGQYRIVCGLGRRENRFNPCRLCTALCRPDDRLKAYKPSLNGTFVNSTAVDVNGVIIRPGDIISIGETKLRVEGI